MRTLDLLIAGFLFAHSAALVAGIDDPHWLTQAIIAAGAAFTLLARPQ